MSILSRRPVQWMVIWELGKNVYENGRDLVTENLTKKERADFRELVVKSKGRPGKLSQRERTRFTRLTRKALTGDPNAGWLGVSRAVATAVPARVVSDLVRLRGRKR